MSANLMPIGAHYIIGDQICTGMQGHSLACKPKMERYAADYLFLALLGAADEPLALILISEALGDTLGAANEIIGAFI